MKNEILNDYFDLLFKRKIKRAHFCILTCLYFHCILIIIITIVIGVDGLGQNQMNKISVVSLSMMLHKQPSQLFAPHFNALGYVAKRIKRLFNFTPAEASAWNLMMLIAVISLALGMHLRCCSDMAILGDTFSCIV